MGRRFVLTLLALGISAAFVSAQPAPDPRPPRPERMHQQMMQKLNLTDQQKSDIQKLRADFEKKTIETQSKIRSLQVDLRQLAMADDPDRGAIEKTVSQITDLQKQQKMDRIDHLFAVRKVLTPEQRKTWKNEMMSLAGEHGGRMMRGRGMRNNG